MHLPLSLRARLSPFVQMAKWIYVAVIVLYDRIIRCSDDWIARLLLTQRNYVKIVSMNNPKVTKRLFFKLLNIIVTFNHFIIFSINVLDITYFCGFFCYPIVQQVLWYTLFSLSSLNKIFLTLFNTSTKIRRQKHVLNILGKNV